MSGLFQKVYSGTVKDLYGPAWVELSSSGKPGAWPAGSGEKAAVPALAFDYSDSFSVFDWGRMPDTLSSKGEALAILAAHWFEKFEQPETWREFSKSPQALAIRKANRFGAAFNEIGERLQERGLRTHYLGVLGGKGAAAADGKLVPQALSECQALPGRRPRRLVVKEVKVARPQFGAVLGRQVPDYGPTRASLPPKLVPLEVVFRFSCPPGSSLLERSQKEPGYLAARGFGDLEVRPGSQWDFPVLELFTKLEPTDRPVGISEALALSGLTAQQLNEVLLTTAWVAAWLKAQVANASSAGLELADGKLEWAISPQGELWLVDAVGPDELRLLKGQTQLSKEILRTFYRSTPWYEVVNQAKERAARSGQMGDWKKGVSVPPPALPAEWKELGAQVYLTLANVLTQKTWFPEAWDLPRLLTEAEHCVKSLGGSSS